MKACTSINVFFDSEFQASVQEQMRRTADGGFRHVDMNFWDWSHSEKSPFKQPDWRRWVEGIGAAARRMGLTLRKRMRMYTIFMLLSRRIPMKSRFAAPLKVRACWASRGWCCIRASARIGKTRIAWIG